MSSSGDDESAATISYITRRGSVHPPLQVRDRPVGETDGAGLNGSTTGESSGFHTVGIAGIVELSRFLTNSRSDEAMTDQTTRAVA